MNPTITINKETYSNLVWKLNHCTNAPEFAIWCADENEDTGIAFIHKEELYCCFTGPNLDLDKAIRFFSCLTKNSY